MTNVKGSIYEQELKAKKKSLTSLEKEKEEKRKEKEEEEKLETIGQESEKKGGKWVREEVKEGEKEEKRLFNTELEWLTHKRKFRDEEYLRALASVFYHKLKAVDWPLGFHYKVIVDGRLLHAEIRDNYNRRFTKGIKVTGEVKYDHHAVGKLAIEAENTIDELEKPNGELKKTKGGIFLP